MTRVDRFVHEVLPQLEKGRRVSDPCDENGAVDTMPPSGDCITGPRVCATEECEPSACTREDSTESGKISKRAGWWPLTRLEHE